MWGSKRKQEGKQSHQPRGTQGSKGKQGKQEETHREAEGSKGKRSNRNGGKGKQGKQSRQREAVGSRRLRREASGLQGSACAPADRAASVASAGDTLAGGEGCVTTGSPVSTAAEPRAANCATRWAACSASDGSGYLCSMGRGATASCGDKCAASSTGAREPERQVPRRNTRNVSGVTTAASKRNRWGLTGSACCEGGSGDRVGRVEQSGARNDT